LISHSDLTTLIPSSGSINSACNYNLACKDPGSLNIGSSLAISEIQKNIETKIILSIKEKKETIYQFKPFENIKFVEIGNTKNITETISKSLKHVTTKWCLINPITTIPSSKKINDSFIEFGLNKLPKENWASICFDKNKNPIFLTKSDKNSYGLMSYPFTGRILAKTEDIKMAINKLNDFEKNDLINLAKKLFEVKEIKIIHNIWLDIGHLATYPITRITSINSRFFNKFFFDKQKNTIKKKSNNKTKIKQEIFFYKTIPNEIKRYFPMIFSVSKSKEEISYEMEYISKPNLSEIYLFGSIGPNAVLRIFNSIKRVFQTLYDKEYFAKENASWLYSLKTIKRQSQIKKIIEIEDYKILDKIYNNDFILNNLRFPSLKKTFSLLEKKLNYFENNRPLHIGHGDLCFNNILVDPLFGTINLIDPKAEKHVQLKKYGLIDSLYDLSKLNHSIEGFYDSIVNNLFTLNINNFQNISLEVYKPPEYEIYNLYFKNIMAEKIDNENLKLLTGNLFLSMLPMHLDNIERVISLALLGSIYMSEYNIKQIFK
tara:strand:+ start:2862 stop:4496 length:1635 start_codon:yes stop_codon:yes gene_type:complete